MRPIHAALVLILNGCLFGAVNALAANKPAANEPGPAGWRGDGSGHYPNAAPPLTWSKSPDGKTKNILWQRRMPSYSWATPLVVGDRLFVRAEPYDLVCLDKNTGKVLWHRAHGPWEVVAEADRKNPAWPQVVEAVKQLEEVNNAVYADVEPPKEQTERKNQLQKELKEMVGKIGRKYRMPPEMWRGKWSGYTGSTPCTDGRLLWFTSCMGVVGCYDLDGNAKWLASEPVSSAQMGEHGGGSSPALVGDLLIYCLNSTVVALDRATGKPVWRRDYHGGDDAPSIVPLPTAGAATTGGAASAAAAAATAATPGRPFIIAKKHFLDARDGAEVEFKDGHLQAMSMHATPVIDGSTAYFLDSAGRLFWCRWAPAPAPQAGGLNVSRTGLLEFPLADESKRWDNGANYWVPSPLYLDGLVYCLSNQGRLVVVDVAKSAIASDQKLDLDVDIYRSGMHGGYIVGVCASPTLAGNHIYVTDNTGTCLVLGPGPRPRALARNKIEQTVQPWDAAHWDKPHQECTLASPVFEGSRIYQRSELYVYCIGEK